MWEFIQQNSFVVGAFTGGLAAYLLSLVVNYLTREKKMLAYSVASRKIVERGHKDLAITYRNQPIERLYSHQVVVRNAGNRALKELPIRMSCKNGKFVESELTVPDGASFNLVSDDTGQTVIVHCDLLNKGESFSVGLTAVDTSSDKISVTARAENLVCKELSESSSFPELIDLIVGPTIGGSAVAELIKVFFRILSK
jgi:hypothetical protein